MNFEGSHWGDCYRSHHECAIAEVERLRAELEAAQKRIAELENKLLLAQADMANSAKDTNAYGASTLIVTPECDHRDPAPGGGYYVCGQPAVLNGKCVKHQSEPNTVAAKDIKTYETSTGNTDAPS